MGDFLNAALHKAIATAAGESSTAERAGGGDWRKADNGRPPLPPEDAQLPDLLLIGDGTHALPIDAKTKPRDYEPQRWNFSQIHHRQVQVRSLFRSYWQPARCIRSGRTAFSVLNCNYQSSSAIAMSVGDGSLS